MASLKLYCIVQRFKLYLWLVLVVLPWRALTVDTARGSLRIHVVLIIFTGSSLFSLDHDVLSRTGRWFLAYLVLNSILMMYGVFAGFSIFMTEIEEKQLFEATFVNTITNERIPANATIILNYFMHGFLEIVFVTILCSVMGTVVTGFTIYNLSLAILGMTANEVGKWRDFAEVSPNTSSILNQLSLELSKLCTIASQTGQTSA